MVFRHEYLRIADRSHFREGMGGCVQLNGARIPALDNGYSPQLDQFLHACLSLNTWDRPTAQQAYNYANSNAKARSKSSALTISGTCFNTSTPTQRHHVYKKEFVSPL